MAFLIAFNISGQSFAQFMDSSVEFSFENLKEKYFSNLVNGNSSQELNVENICNQIALCPSSEELGENSVYALYMTPEELRQEMSGNLSKEEIAAIYRQEKADYEKLFNRTKVILLSLPADSPKRVDILTKVLPALLLTKTAVPEEVKDFSRRAYLDYFLYIDQKYPTIGKIQKNSSKMQDLGKVIFAYGLVAKKGDGHKNLLSIMSKTPLTSLGLQTIPSFIGALISIEEYDLIENFLKAASYREVANNRGKVLTALENFGNLFSPTAYISQSDSIKNKYAGGNITPYGYYALSGEGENVVLGNIWEDIPQILVSEGGAAGIKIINDIFYNGLTVSINKNFVPAAYWEHGVMIPFIIGALNTNKIEGRAIKGNESLRKYYGANLAGLVEINLMSYKMYDLNNPTYKRVHEIIAAPYLAQINAKLNGDNDFQPARNNFNILKNTDIQDEWNNQFNGMIYSPQAVSLISGNKKKASGLILRESDATRNGNRQMWSSVLKYAKWGDIAIAATAAFQLAQGMVSLSANIAKNVRLVKAAHSMNVNCSFVGIIKGLRNRPALKTALELRRIRAKEIKKLEMLKVKSIQTANRAPSILNSARAKMNHAELELAKSRHILENKANFLQKRPAEVKAITKEWALSQNNIDPFNSSLTFHNQNPAPVSKTPRADISYQMQSWFDINTKYQANLNAYNKAKQTFKYIKKGKPRNFFL